MRCARIHSGAGVSGKVLETQRILLFRPGAGGERSGYLEDDGHDLAGGPRTCGIRGRGTLNPARAQTGRTALLTSEWQRTAPPRACDGTPPARRARAAMTPTTPLMRMPCTPP